MDIKMEVKKLVVYAKCEELSAWRGDGDAEEYHQHRRLQSFDAINRWIDMAEEAIELVRRMRDIPSGKGG